MDNPRFSARKRRLSPLRHPGPLGHDSEFGTFRTERDFVVLGGFARNVSV